jgi:hypothetical protein
MQEAVEPAANEPLPHRIASVYEPDETGAMRVYSGPIAVRADGEDVVGFDGDIILRLSPTAMLSCDAVGDPHRAVFGPGFDLLGPSPGASLDRPDPELPGVGERKTGMVRVSSAWLERTVRGDLTRVRRLLVHVSGRFSAHLPVADVEPAPGRQERIDLPGPGWRLSMASVRSDPNDEHRFSHVIEATSSTALSEESIEDLVGWLFHLLSFVSSREVGVPVIVGLDVDGQIAWVSWASPRQRNGAGGVRWCSGRTAAAALPVLSAAYSTLKEEDPVLYDVTRRAIDFHLSAEAGGVLDVRVPIACAGLELLSWAVLQREGWIGTEGLSALNAGAKVRLLMRASGIPEAIPEHFTALRTRAAAEGQPDWAGPETLFRIRNALMHPPKRRLASVDWPTPDELLESWQLSMWYLELAILRTLGYSGDYWSRLRLDRHEADVERVPWAGG